MASSLDGYIGTHSGESDAERLSIGFLSLEDHQQVEQVLSQADAVVLGAESLRLSPGIWHVPNHMESERKTRWVVMTNQGIPPEHAFWQDRETPRLIASSNVDLLEICQKHGVEFFHLTGGDGISDVRQLCYKLASLQTKELILFGGGKINRLFYAADLVDEIHLTICPFIVASSDAPRFVDPPLGHPKKFSLVSFESIKSHVILKYRSHHL